MPRVTLGVSLGLLLTAVGLALTLSGSPITVARASTLAPVPVGHFNEPLEACQPHEVLPRGTSAIRLHAFDFIGPRTTVWVLEHGRVITRGERGSGWTSGVVTVPVRPLSRTRPGVTLCFAFQLNGYETTFLAGEATTPTLGAQGQGSSLGWRIAAEYLRPAPSSWWSLLPTVARHMGLGRAASGTWWVWLAVALMTGVVLLSSLIALRELE